MQEENMVIRKAYLVLLLPIVIGLFGCSDREKPAEATAESPTGTATSPEMNKPAYGDMMIKGSIGDATVLLPVLASDAASGDINGYIYNGLVKYDKDINLVGDLAEKWEISDDNLKIRF
jgi:peptide/nickel transport system substrate-binding protein